MRLLAALGVWALGLLSIAALDDPRLRFPLFLVEDAGAIAAWLFILRAARGERNKHETMLLFASALAARIVFLFLAPAFSEDVFRYVYEGRVVWRMGPSFPWSHPPSSAPIAGVPAELLDASWLRINHADVPTIYPLAAQIVFAVAGGLGDLAGGGHLLILKSLLVACDLGAMAILARLLVRIGRSASEAWALALYPGLVLEVAREGHADSIALLGFAIGAFGFVQLRPREGYVGFALAAIAKLNGVVLLPAAMRATKRGLGLATAILVGLFVPLVVAGAEALGGLVHYATEWRSGDGVFSLILTLAEAILGGDYRSIAGWTLTRHQLARAISALAFLASGIVILWRRPALEEVIERAGLLLLLLLLLSPTLHPWYAIWLVPFVPFATRARSAMLALLVLAPLLHHPGWLELAGGEWKDLAWVRALVHAPAWILLAHRIAFERRAS
jgi:hypothetical protein